jgi:long-subunit fatty acid transport protein
MLRHEGCAWRGGVLETQQSLGEKTIGILLGLAFLLLTALSANQFVWAQAETPIVISSSPTPVGSGARAAGVANAFIAVADDATAASWNPAGLVQLERPEISAVGSYYCREDSAGDVERVGVTQSEAYRIGTDTTESVDLNFLSVAYPFMLLGRNMTVSLNYQREFDFNRDFDLRYEQTGDVFDTHADFQVSQKGGLYALTPAIAVQIVPTLSLGVAFNVWGSEYFREDAWTSTKRTTVKEEAKIPDILDTRSIVVETQKFRDFLGWNATFGLFWNARSDFNFGAVVNLPFQADLKVDQRIESLLRDPDDPERLQIEEGQDIEMDFPVSYGVGVAYRPMDSLTFSLDYMRVEWKDFVFTDQAGNRYSVITSLPADEDGNADVGATNTVRVGVEYLFIWPRLVWPLRGGFFYDPEPSAGGTDDYFGFAVGSGVTFKRVTLDLAYTLKLGNDIKPSNIGEVRDVPELLVDVRQHTLLFSAVARF